MKTNESTYALLVRSEEKGRGILEVVLYTFFILSVSVSIWQFADQPVNVPAAGLLPPTSITAITAQSGANRPG